jgi:alginate O-acetyltransferase complex protein AlgJ
MVSTPKAPAFDDSFVHKGRDGWLFLVGGSNSVSSLYDRNSVLAGDDTIRKWADLIEQRARRFEQMGIQYVHINVPEKLTIYGDKLWDPPIVDWRLSPVVRLREMLAQSPYGHVWLDLIEPFTTAPNKDDLYFKTDSHWSGEGCYSAYSLLCERIGLEPEPDLLNRAHQSIDGKLDMGSKFDPPIYEPAKFYDFRMKTQRVYSNAIARYLETPRRYTWERMCVISTKRPARRGRRFSSSVIRSRRSAAMRSPPCSLRRRETWNSSGRAISTGPS